MVLTVRKELSAGWTFKRSEETTEEAWRPARNVPTEVHLDLQEQRSIADPLQDLNELSTRWVAELSWTYRIRFHVPEASAGQRTDLVFDGLDTFATVYINGKEALKSDNAFIGHRVAITDHGEMELQIKFEPARRMGLELVKEHPEHRFIVHQTECSRGPVRKAQFQWGWDWGPILNTCGPWKRIFLETYESRIVEVWLEYNLSPDLDTVNAVAHAMVDGAAPSQLKFTLVDADNQIAVDTTAVRSDDNHYAANFELKSPRLWWPRGYGTPHRYSLEAKIRGHCGLNVDCKIIPVGFRNAVLVQEDDSNGKSFYFRINRVDVFSGGSCWIPADSFVSRITPERYREWIQLAADGNQTILRVWGGGIYEPEVFYDACDELGIMVWQDFMFACASYPTYPDFLASVEEEAQQNTRRLRHHPSIVIWAGNNEDYQLIERYGLEYPYKKVKDPQSWLKSTFPSRYIYEHLLPTIVETEIPGAIYHPSSPWGDGTSTVLKVDQTVGDVHQWNVWHGEMKPYQQLPRMGGRFVSEFGMEAYPHLQTIEDCITDPKQRYPGSMSMDFHNKAIGHERRLMTYLAENFSVKSDLKSFTHLSQVMQADAMSWAYKGWRRQWGKPKERKCGGVLVWQLNDCWPTISWSVIDYYLVPKPAYYAIKRALAPLSIGVARKGYDWTTRPADAVWQRDTAHVDPTRILTEILFDVWIASQEQKTVQGVVKVRFVSIKTGHIVRKDIERRVSIAPNGTTEIMANKLVPIQGQDPLKPFSIDATDAFVIWVSLVVNGAEISSDTSWPDPIKYLNFEQRGLTVSKSEGGEELVVSTERPVKGFAFSEKKGVKLSDNGFDLMPWEVKRIAVEGAPSDEFFRSWSYVGCT